MSLLKKMLPCVVAVVAVVICLFMLPTEANAASVDDLTYYVSGGKVTITDCKEDASGELVIPSTIEGYPVTAIGARAFRECAQLKCIVIPEGVTSIGSYAIGTDYNVYNLEKIFIPSTLNSIGEMAFYGCYNLKEIHIADLTSWVNLPKVSGVWNTPFCSGGDMYISGEKITNLIIPDGIQRIPDYAFYLCGSINSVTFPDSVTTIGGWAFASTGLKNFDFNNVSTVEGSAFSGCSLECVTMPNRSVNIDFTAFIGTKKFYAAPDNRYYSTDDQGALYNKAKTILMYMPQSLRVYVVPASVTRIMKDALGWTHHLLFLGSEEQWESIVFEADATMVFDVCCNYVEGMDFHTWKKSGVSVEASCKNYGEIRYTCNACYQNKTETVEKLVTHTWSEAIPLSNSAKAYLCITCGKVKVEGVVSIENEKDHFHKDAKIEVIVIDNTYEEAHQVVSTALKNHHDYVAYDISAILQDSYVQPNGTIEVKIAIPDDFNLDTIAIAYISNDGQLVNIPCTVDRENRVAKFYTDHFSYYAMTTGAPGESQQCNHSYKTEWSKDNTTHWHECALCYDKKDLSAHTPGEAPTESAAQTCTACGYVINPALNHAHNFATTWVADGSNHWHTCNGCEERAELEAHSWENGVCTVCGTDNPNETAKPTEPTVVPTTPGNDGNQNNNSSVWIFVAIGAVCLVGGVAGGIAGGIIISKKKQ